MAMEAADRMHNAAAMANMAVARGDLIANYHHRPRPN
jgi:hypothetical protein